MWALRPLRSSATPQYAQAESKWSQMGCSLRGGGSTIALMTRLMRFFALETEGSTMPSAYGAPRPLLVQSNSRLGRRRTAGLASMRQSGLLETRFSGVGPREFELVRHSARVLPLMV